MTPLLSQSQPHHPFLPTLTTPSPPPSSRHPQAPVPGSVRLLLTAPWGREPDLPLHELVSPHPFNPPGQWPCPRVWLARFNQQNLHDVCLSINIIIIIVILITISCVLWTRGYQSYPQRARGAAKTNQPNSSSMADFTHSIEPCPSADGWWAESGVSLASWYQGLQPRWSFVGEIVHSCSKQLVVARQFTRPIKWFIIPIHLLVFVAKLELRIVTCDMVAVTWRVNKKISVSTQCGDSV